VITVADPLGHSCGSPWRPASISPESIESFHGWLGARLPRSPSASACRHGRR